MKHIAIRDDDACFFTDASRFALVHSPLLDKGIPLNLSAIPFVSANVRLRHTKLRGEYEPFIPPQYSGKAACFPIGDNKALVNLARRHPRVQIVQHGYSHAYVDGEREFEITDAARIAKMADAGADILEKTFGARPAFFVSPWDRISRTAFRVLAKRFEGISAAWISRQNVPPRWLLKYALKKIRRRNYIVVGGALILEHASCLLTKFKPPGETRDRLMRHLEKHDYVTLVTHHWEFFNEDGSPNAALISGYHEIIAELTARKDVRLASFDQIRRAVLGE